MHWRTRFRWTVLSLLTVGSMILAACGGAEAPPTADGTAATAQTSGAATTTPAATGSPPAGGETAWYVDQAPGPPQAGGMINYLLYEDPDSLNPLVGQTSIAVQVSAAILEPLAETLPDGSWAPILATEIPTLDNGGVSEDLKTVTWKLREGVTWHDGEPFTSEDVKFTWEAASSVAGGSAVASDYELIESIETPDPHTVVVHYTEFNVGYVDQFPWILPKHATGDVSDMLNWEFNRAPIGTGPFTFEEWAAGSHITVAKNESYWQEGKPYLDGINFLVVPSEESRAAQMLQGDAHVMLWPGESSQSEFEQSDVAKVRTAPGIWVMQLRFNLSQPFDGDPGAEPPHPILGDQRVREAIAMAIDRQRINQDILEGRVYDIDSPLQVGWMNCQVEEFTYDPEAAKQLLEEAGWVDTDGDGIREAKGAQHAPDGTKMELSMNGYTSFKPLELAELAVQEDLAKIGIKVNIENQDFAVIFGTWEDGSPRLVGDFDMLFYDSGLFIEPHAQIRAAYHPNELPSADNPDGDNYYRWVRDDVGQWIEAAGSSPDTDVRRENYCKVADAIREDLPVFPILQFNEGSAYSTRLHGFTVSTWEWSTWDAENWWLEQ